jgi:TRAP-type C4-dicarboxylate transport system permease small subunit
MAAFDPYSGAARAIAVALRTAHVLCMAVFAGAVFAGGADLSLPTWRWLAFASGAALLVTEVSHGRHWLWQGRGVATLAHVAVLGLLGVAGLERWAVAAAVVVGSVGSHMPRSLRKWSFRHGRVVE